MDPVETLARRIVRQMWDYTEGLPGRWAPLATIGERLELEDEGETHAAVQFAVEQQWLEEFGGYNSIRLTQAGRGTSATVEEALVEEAFELQAGDAPRQTAENKAA
jgi:hypothetical protein